MQIGLIGCGNMGRALARGWRRPLVCSDPIVERARELAAEVSGAALESNVEVARRCDLLVLAHKPSQLNQVAGEVRPHRHRQHLGRTHQREIGHTKRCGSGFSREPLILPL